MIKIKKIDFGGYGIDHISSSINLRAIALTKYCLLNGSLTGVDSPHFKATIPIELTIHSKISTIQNDFSIKDIIFGDSAELVVCACNEHSVIYCEKRGNLIFKCSGSENEYISSSEYITYENYYNVFVIEESVDYSNKKVTTFDMDLNIINCCVMAFSQPNKYAIEKLNRQSTFNNYIGELRERHPDLIIDCNFNSFNRNSSNCLIAVCYEVQAQREYVVKFNNDKRIEWKLAISDNITTNNILVLENCFFMLYYTDKHGNKWRLSQVSNDGEYLDSYDFKGMDAILTFYNEKPTIIYNDISKLTSEQKLILKITGDVGPAVMLIVE